MIAIKWIFFMGAVLRPITLSAETKIETQSISLAQAKSLALENNPEVAAAKSQVDQRRAMLGSMRSAFYPHVGIAAGANSEINDGTRGNEPIAYIYANFNVFNGFQDSRKASISEIEADKAELEYERIKHLLQVDVEQSFNAYIFAKEAIALRTKALETNRELAATANRRRRAGAASEADVIEFELRESTLRSELVALEQDREDARLALIKEIGRPNQVFEPNGIWAHLHFKGNLSEYLSKLQERGPAIQESKKDLLISEKQADQWQAGWFPKIDFEARSGKLELQDSPADSKRTTEFLLIAKMDIFSGWASTYEKRQGMALKKQTEQKHRSIISKSETDLKRHYSRILTIQKSVDLEDKNVARAGRYYQTVLREYNAGVKNSMDLKAAADLVYETSLKRLRYRHAFLVERGEMERLLGLPVDVEIIQEAP